ncbi:hypothetical protein ONR75_24175 [Rhodopseudomonas sp. P2A-2r]|nr:hypothetical protein [Rhodopseudomonas sp. P2A-2r]UZE47937.1 hypothetical protein ONR75_24175 [Rhodopseudomonas sp. P2A-2r]
MTREQVEQEIAEIEAKLQTFSRRERLKFLGRYLRQLTSTHRPEGS